jgi:hypothetical protein
MFMEQLRVGPLIGAGNVPDIDCVFDFWHRGLLSAGPLNTSNSSLAFRADVGAFPSGFFQIALRLDTTTRAVR